MATRSPLAPEFVAVALKNNVVLSRSSDRTLRAMGKVIEYGNRNTALAKRKVVPAWVRIDSGARSRRATRMARQEGTRGALGLRVPAGELARSLEEAVQIADRIGYPVAMKAQAAKLEHKTEAGGVVLGVADADDVRRVWATLHENVQRAQPGLKLDGVLVEVDVAARA